MTNVHIVGKEKKIMTERQTVGQTDGLMDREIERQTDRSKHMYLPA